MTGTDASFYITVSNFEEESCVYAYKVISAHPVEAYPLMAVMCNSESIKKKRPSVESVPTGGNYLWSSMASVPRDWNCPLLSVESVLRDGNY